MRCLILGATGLIGSHTAGELTRQGIPVRILARGPKPWALIPPRAEAVWVDWNRRAELMAALEGVDVVIHLISSVWPGSPGSDRRGAPGDAERKGPETPTAALEAQTIEGLHPDLAANAALLEGCLAKGVRKLVFLSSGGTVYGPVRHLPIPESHRTAPVNPYGRLKLALERQIMDFCRERPLDWIILRGGNAFGEHHNPQRLQGAVNVFLRHLLLNRPVEIWGSLNTVRDYLYAGDMARALCKAALAPVSQGIYNLGSGEGTRLETLVEMIFRVTGRKVPLTFREGRDGDVAGNVLDIRKIGEDLGWTPETDLAAGIEKTWQWVKKYSG